MVVYHTHSWSVKKSSLEVTDVSVMPVDVLNERLTCTLMQRYPDVTQVHMAKYMCWCSIHNSEGMLIVHGSLDELP